MFSDCRCCLITAFVGDNKLILILSHTHRSEADFITRMFYFEPMLQLTHY